MSEKEKPKETPKETKETDEKEQDIVETNVALLIAERDSLLKTLEEKDEVIEELSKKLAQATDLIEEDSKAALVNAIAPKTHLDKSILGKMSVDELLMYKKVLDNAKVMTIKSGTPVFNKKASPRQELDTMFERNMAKLRGES